MRLSLLCLAVLGGLAAFLPLPARAPEKRAIWTASRVKGSPEPPAPYRLEVAFPKVRFTEPLELVTAPGSDRLYVAERAGKILSFAPRPDADRTDLLIDLKRTVYGLAFHPKFDANGYFFVTTIPDGRKETPTGTRVSRFTAKGGKADPKSEKVILEWPNGGHNGGCLRFGPDGYLYIVTGDGSGIADGLQTGQDVGDLLASMLRIDVDVEGKGYAVPKDNPFVSLKGARPEVYAYGLRQLWKFSFDPKTGDLWGGEVGQDLWEMIYRIEKGGNYGWSVTEGNYPFRPERKKGPTPILKPVVEHDHANFRSITGGYVYRGTRLPELTGAYVYGDYDSGRVWAFRHAGRKVSEHRELYDSSLRIVAFGEARDGELYLLDWIGGQLHRLVKAPPVKETARFPRKLSETGLFASTKDHTPAAGLIPYTVNSQLWSDGATKERFLAIPGDGKIAFDAVEYPQPSPGAPRGWRFPDGTVAVKTFYLDTDKGRRRLETRLLHYEQLGGNEEVGDQYWRGYTYVWNDEQTDAELLEAKGADREFTRPDGTKVNWRFPSRTECSLCHTTPAKYVLGLNTHQLDRDGQLEQWAKWGLFDRPLPEKRARLADPTDAKQPLEARAKAYLQANCTHCHIKWGGGNAEFQLLFTLKPAEWKAIDVPPAHGAFDVKEARLLSPGSPERSLIHKRMTMTGLGRMPHIGSRVVDEKGVKLIAEWIRAMR